MLYYFNDWFIFIIFPRYLPRWYVPWLPCSLRMGQRGLQHVLAYIRLTSFQNHIKTTSINAKWNPLRLLRRMFWDEVWYCKLYNWPLVHGSLILSKITSNNNIRESFTFIWTSSTCRLIPRMHNLLMNTNINLK